MINWNSIDDYVSSAYIVNKYCIGFKELMILSDEAVIRRKGRITEEGMKSFLFCLGDVKKYVENVFEEVK